MVSQTLPFVAIVSFSVLPSVARSQTTYDPERWALYQRYHSVARSHQSLDPYLDGGQIEPHWMADGNCFWYADGPTDSTVVYRVDPLSNRKTELFDIPRLRMALQSFLREEPPGRGVPFRTFEFVDGEQAARFRVGERELTLELGSYRLEESSAEEVSQSDLRPGEWPSPDGQWAAFIKDFNVWVRSRIDGSERQLTHDGVEYASWNLSWSGSVWSPDGSRLAVTKEDARAVPKLPIVRWLGEVPELSWTVGYAPDPSSSGETSELGIITVESGELSRADLRDVPHDWGIVVIGWHPDGSYLLSRFWESASEFHLGVTDPATGRSWLLQAEYPKDWLPSRYPWGRRWILQDGTGVLVLHEEDEWMHIHLFDWHGERIREVTSGPFDVFRLVTVDEQRGWIYFTAQGTDDRPYDAHLYRVRLDGSEFTRLTQALGNHDGPMWWHDSRQEIQFSPSKSFFIDTYSTVKRPPVVELRRADGKLLQTLSRVGIERLRRELKWGPAEEFAVKAADGTTDLHGVLFKPYDFTPEKTYPVIEIVHNICVVPRTFTHGPLGGHARALAQLGFIVVMVDTRDSSGPGGAFRTSYGRESIKDHVATLKNLRRERPYMDLSRVGVLGYSGGGPTALWAMLEAPDVYHVGVAGGVMADDALPGHVDKLQGKLLLVLATADARGGILRMMMRTIDALIRAGKPYDLMIMPDEVHGLYARPASYPYYLNTLAWYFGEHLKPQTWRGR